MGTNEQCNWRCCAVLSHSVVSDSLWPCELQPARLLCPWGLSTEEYWSRLPCPPPGDLPNPGIKPTSLSLLHWWVGSLPLAPPGKTQLLICSVIYLVSRRFPSSSIPGPLGHSLHWHSPTPPPLLNSHLETYRSPLFWVKCHSSYFQDTLVSFPDLRKFCLKKINKIFNETELCSFISFITSQETSGRHLRASDLVKWRW